MEIIEHWNIKPLSLPKANEYLEAVDLFMLLPKIGSIIIDGCIDYSSETKLKDTSLVIGEAYYSEIFKNQKDHYVAYKGDYISRFPLNDSMTYIIHCALLLDEEIEKISGLCDQYTKLFISANEYIKGLSDQLVAPNEDTPNCKKMRVEINRVGARLGGQGTECRI